MSTVKQYQKDPLTQNRELLKNPSVQAMLKTIRYAEGTAGERGYNTRVGYSQFDDLSKKPGKKVYIPSIKDFSSAEGAYQFLNSTWDGVSKKLGLKDFSPESQDLAAIELIKNRGALKDVLSNNLEGALTKLSGEWASLPTSEGKSAYKNQNSRKIADLSKVFFGGNTPTTTATTAYAPTQIQQPIDTTTSTLLPPPTQTVSYLANPALFANLADTQVEAPKEETSIQRGNTQEQDFMRDLLSQVSQGVAYVEPEKSQVFQDGGMSPKQFTLNYINSPKYKERLQDSRYEDINAEVKQRTLNSNPVVSPYKKQSWLDGVLGKEPPERGSYYNNLSKTLQLDTEDDVKTFKKIYPSATPPTPAEIETHERSHAATPSFPESRLNITDIRKLTNYHKNTPNEEHDLQPEENKADLDAFRYMLKKQGIYDAGTQDFTKEHFKKAKKSASKDRLQKVYSDDAIIYLMNHVAENNSENDNFFAQNGGTHTDNEQNFLKEYFHEGGKHKPVPVSSEGMYEYPNQEVLVPTNGSITMAKIPHPILGISEETGEKQIMQPEGEYYFNNTQTIAEIPLTQAEANFLKDIYSTNEKS